MAVQLAAAVLVACRLRHGLGRRPALKTSTQPLQFGESVSVSVVIPARNESARIVACVESVRRHSPAAEIIVVDDASEDDTATKAVAAGTRVVTAGPLPRGWVGKPWALQQGLDAATGEVVVFIDADVRLQADAVSVVVNELQHHDVVSLSARLVTSSPLEQALSAAMVTTLVYRFGPVGRATEPAPDRVMGNGQYLAAHRLHLTNEGGFALAANHMTDDIALLRALAHRGLHIAFLDGSQLIDTKMYSSASETWRQWPRSLPMNDTTTPVIRALDTATLWLTMGLPLWRILLGKSTLLDKFLLGQRVLISAALFGSYRAPRWAVLASPLLDLPVVARLTWTTIRPVREWRGRQYPPSRNATR